MSTSNSLSLPRDSHIALTQLMDQLMNHAGPITPEEILLVRDRISDLVHYEAVVGVLGKSGAGKSALCNALFGQETTRVSPVEPGTRYPQEITLAYRQGKGLSLIDVPGVGAREAQAGALASLYTDLLPELDLILWVIKGDDRALQLDEQVYRQVIAPFVRESGIPLLFVLNQIDKIEPSREWQWDEARPGDTQSRHIAQKREQVARTFNVPLTQVCAVSAAGAYGLVTLIDQIIGTLPQQKRWGLARETRPEALSTDAREQSEASLWRSIAQVLRDVLWERADWLLLRLRILGLRLRIWFDGL